MNNFYMDAMRVLDTSFHELPEYRMGAINTFGALKVHRSLLPESFVLSLFAKHQKWFFTSKEKEAIAETISELCGNIPATVSNTRLNTLMKLVVNEATQLNESEAPVNVSAANSPTPPDANIQSPDILLKPPKKKKLCGLDKVVCENASEINMFNKRPTLYICGDFKIMVGV